MWLMEDERYLEFQATLKKEAAGLVSVDGYNKLERRFEDVADWEVYQEFLAQINITLWFKEKDLIKEIEPKLPHRGGSSDILLSLSQQDIYCEVKSFESLAKSLESKTQGIKDKLKKLSQGQPWLTEHDIESENQISRIIKHLLRKTEKQLPPNYPGILALETRTSQIYCYKIKEVAKKLFPKRPQVTLIMLWSLERGGTIDQPVKEAPFWFLNRNSSFSDTGRGLLKYLKQEHKVTECG